MTPAPTPVMHTRRPLATLAALVAIAMLGAAACSDRTPSAPSGLETQSGTQVGTDTTTGVLLPASVHVRGRALVTTKDGPRAPGDTLSSFAPIAGARITLYRNVLIDGQGVSVKFGERTTGADGVFDFTGVPGGYFILSLNVTPEQFYGETFVYVLGTRAEVTADVRVWQMTP